MMNSHLLKDKIQQLSMQYFDDTIALRRNFHQYPELSGEEFGTATFIVNTLKNYGIESETYLNNTAVVALIEGNEPHSGVIALRADMDALPVEENNNLPFRSQHAGIMHACGHDVHIASLLTTARILQELKTEWNGSVKLIFQPSEEKFPGGAIQLIEAGVLNNPKVDKMLGMHVSPEIETGKIGMKSGSYMASTDEIYITVIGKGGHAAIPDMFVNPLLIASKILIKLESFCQDYAPKDTKSVLTFGRIVGNGKTNIVPDKVFLEGTLRTFDEQFRAKAHSLILEIASDLATKMGGRAEVLIDGGYPTLINDEQLTEKTFSIAQDLLEKNNVLSLDCRMTAEDFAYYSRRVPSVFYRLGTGGDGYNANLHSPDFLANEDAMQLSPAVMAYLAVSLL